MLGATPDFLKITGKNIITIEMPSVREGSASAELLVLAKSLYLGITQVNEEYEHKYISVKEEITNA